MIDEAATEVHHDPKKEPRVTVLLHDSRNPGLLELYFEHYGEDPPFRGFKVLTEGEIDTRKLAGLARRMPHYVAYARSEIGWKWADRAKALETLRAETGTRGLPDRFYRAVANEYRDLVANDDPHPIKTIAERRPVDKSRASRWVSEARRRGYLKEGANQ